MCSRANFQLSEQRIINSTLYQPQFYFHGKQQPSMVISAHYCGRCATSLGTAHERCPAKINEQRLAGFVSFLPVLAMLICVFLCQPKPLPTSEGLAAMPWWAPLGGLIGSVAVIVGLMFVQKVGGGTLAGLTITANILMSLIIDKYGMFGMTQHPLSLGRIAGGALMVVGIYLISKF